MKFIFACLFFLWVKGDKLEDVTFEPPPRDVTTNVTYSICPSIPKPIVITECRGAFDSIFYLWSAFDAPVLIIALSSPGATLNINCSLLNSSDFVKSITFSHVPEFISAFQVMNVIEYQDSDDIANLENIDPSLVQLYRAEDFDWEYEPILGVLLSYSFRATAHNGKNISDGRGISFEFHPNGFQEREKVSPALFYTTNSSLINVVFDHVVLPTTSNVSRYGIQMFTLNLDSDGYSYHCHKTLDDEFSPTVFTMYELITPQLVHGGRHFYQWKPISFTREEHDVNYSTDLLLYPVKNVSSDSLKNNTVLIQAVMGDIDGFKVTSWNVTFGVEEDGFYVATNYTDWTFLTGYGQPFQDTYSWFVIMITASCIVAPTFISLMGVVGIMIWKACRNSVVVV